MVGKNHDNDEAGVFYLDSSEECGSEGLVSFRIWNLLCRNEDHALVDGLFVLICTAMLAWNVDLFCACGYQ